LNNNDAKVARGQPNQAKKKRYWKFSTKIQLKVRLTGRLKNSSDTW